MKILFITRFGFPYGSAAASRVRNLARSFSEVGVSTKVIPFTIFENSSEDIEVATEVYKGVNFLTTEKDEAVNNRNKLPLYKYLNMYQTGLLASKFLDAYLQKEKFDAVIIYGQSSLHLEMITRIVRKHKLPMFFDVVEWPTQSYFKGGCINPLYWDTKRFMESIPMLSDGVIAISSYIASMFPKTVKTMVVPALVEPDLMPQPMFSSQVCDNKPFLNLTYIGTLDEKDDPDVMFQAVKRINENLKNVTLNIAGKYESSKSWIKYKDLCSSDNCLKRVVRFHGQVTKERFSEFIQSSDVLILLKRKDEIAKAAFPTRLPELLLSGRPVVTSDSSDVLSYLTDGSDAFIAPAGNITGVVERIELLYQSAKLRNEMGRKGYSSALKAFGYQAYSHKLLGFIGDIIYGK